MRPHLALTAACAVLQACAGRDYAISSRKADFHVDQPLVEFPTTLVGVVAHTTVKLVHDGGPAATVRAIEVQPMLGDAFRPDTDLPLALPESGEVDLNLDFLPSVRGPSLARLVLVSDAETSRLTLDLRGIGAEASARMWPDRLDFGSVGTSRLLTAHLDNTGDWPLTVQSFAAPALPPEAFGVALPILLEPGESIEVPITVATQDPLETQVEVITDTGRVNPIHLVANRCEIGGTAAFDGDGDGVSACAGDCDDTAASVYPGATEIADGLDQDCDTLVDEATAAYDDDRDGSTEEEGDCDDGDPSRHPHAAEEPNGVDDDCDAKVDEGTRAGDDDADGYTEDGGDCNDANPEINPAKLEIPDNAVDDDCDGVTR